MILKIFESRLRKEKGSSWTSCCLGKLLLTDCCLGKLLLTDMFQVFSGPIRRCDQSHNVGTFLNLTTEVCSCCSGMRGFYLTLEKENSF